MPFSWMHLPYGAGSLALHGVIEVWIMLIYQSDKHGLKYAQVDHLHSFLKLEVFGESDVKHWYEPLY